MPHPALVDDTLEFSPWARQLTKVTARILATLTPREERAVRLYYWNDDATYDQVGASFNVTRERARQIIARAIRKLKHPARSRYLRPFLDDSGRHTPPLRELEKVVRTEGLATPRDALPDMLPPPKSVPVQPVLRDKLVLGKGKPNWPPRSWKDAGGPRDNAELLRQMKEAEQEKKDAARMNDHWLAILAAYGGEPVYGPYGYIIDVKRNK